MSEAKFTPAPWCRSWISGALRHICRNVDFDAFWMPTAEERDSANLPTYYGTNDVDLICAAPDLLAACEAALKCVQSLHVRFYATESDELSLDTILHAAIAKANATR